MNINGLIPLTKESKFYIIEALITMLKPEQV